MTGRPITIVLHDLAGGGTERVALALAGAWSDAGREVTIFCGDPRGPAADWLPSGPRLVSPAVPIPRGSGARRRLGAALAEHIRAHRSMTLVAPGNYHIPLLTAAARALGPARPRLVAKLSNPLMRPDRGRVRQHGFAAIMRRRCRAIDTLVAIDPTLADEAARITGHPGITVVPDPLVVQPTPRRRPAGRDALLFVGRLVPQKRADLAIRALEALPGAILTIVGEGPERASLTALAANLGLADRVVFAGWIPDMADVFSQFDVLLSTSRFEGVPGVLIEALAAGLPVVATASSPALPQLFANMAASLVAPEPATIAAAVKALGGRHVPDAAAQTLREARSLPSVADRWLRVIDGRSRTPARAYPQPLE